MRHRKKDGWNLKVCGKCHGIHLLETIFFWVGLILTNRWGILILAMAFLDFRLAFHRNLSIPINAWKTREWNLWNHLMGTLNEFILMELLRFSSNLHLGRFEFLVWLIAPDNHNDMLAISSVLPWHLSVLVVGCSYLDNVEARINLVLFLTPWKTGLNPLPSLKDASTYRMTKRL